MYRILLVVFHLLFFCCADAQVPFIRDFWLNESNTPVKVNDLIYESSGYLWLGTDKGVYRFNGRTFTAIPDSIQQPVTALAFYRGSLLAGFRNGKIGMLHNDSIVAISFQNSNPSSAITSLHSKGPLLWITTEDEGLFMVMNDAAVRMSVENGLTDNFIYDAAIAEDEIMITTDRGINHVRWNGRAPVVEVFTTAQGLPDNIVRVLSPIPDTRLCWVGTQEGGLALYDDKDEMFRPLKMRYPWAWGQINDVLPVTPLEAWVATEDGYLLKIERVSDSLEVTPYTYEGRKLKRLARDNAGNIWCATNSGLMMSTTMYASYLGMPASFKLKDITAMVVDAQNTLWFTQNSKLFRLPLSPDSEPEYVLTAPDTIITCLYPDGEDRIWIGTFANGLMRYANGRITAVRTIPELKEGLILSIAGANKHLWIASLNGVEETVSDPSDPDGLRMIRHHDKLAGIGSDYVYQLYPDRQGRMWMATDGAGVSMYDGSKYHRWDDSSGLVSEVIYSIAEDAYGQIWASALEKGLLKYDGKEWTLFNDQHGLQHINITSIKGNKSGQVVIVNEEGIDQWHPQSRQFRHYNRRLGMDIDSTSAVLNCIAADTAGNVYVPFEHGFVVLRNIDTAYDIKPAVRINKISLFFQPLERGRREFRHNENHISFTFDGINYTNPERLYYRYMLEGYDNNWIYTNDEIIPFAQLPHGNYRFRVQASLNNVFVNANEDSYAFTITRPFWRTPWFFGLVAVGLLAIGYIFIRVREQNIRKLSRLQRERMVFEYEHLKSQVNPHFLFNSLNTLVNLIEEDRESAVDYTVHLSDLYRNMLSFKDQDLIPLSEEYRIIVNYMHIQQTRFGNALQLETSIPGHLLKTKKIIPLALQLLVENAIKHNVVSMAQPLTITIEASEDEITVSNPIQPKQSKEKGAGLGLLNIKKRYKLLTARNTKFGIENGYYTVTLPLL